MLKPELFAFLRDLKENNNRDWFQENKDRFEEELREPLLHFIREFEPHLAEISPYFLALAKKSGGSLFRIYRDVRFGKDKTPYKTNAALHFRHENGKDAHCPGFYLHLDPNECFCGAGIWRPDSPSLRSIREAIVEKPKEWAKVIGNPNFQLQGDSLKRAPKGFDPEHPLIEDLKRKDHMAVINLSIKDVMKKNFLDTYVEHCVQMAPYVEFIARSVGQPF